MQACESRNGVWMRALTLLPIACNAPQVRANQVRQHLQETIPTLAMSPVLKVFIKNTAISVISQMGSPEPARVD